MTRQNISSNTPWESVVGYSRAVVVNSLIYISGTTATDETGQIVGKDDAYEQTKQIVRNIESTLLKAGARLENVVRTRIYVSDINNWESVGKAHEEYFKKIMPATTMVEVTRLISPEILVEIEADAIL